MIPRLSICGLWLLVAGCGVMPHDGSTGGASGAPSGRGAGASPPAVQATVAEIRAHLQRQGQGQGLKGSAAMKVLSFAGYSGSGYQDPQALLAQARAVLQAHDPSRTLVNIGGTAAGIGAVYALAKAMGFGTLGIVSTLARDEAVALSPDADQVFYIADAQWGGRTAPDGPLSPTSQAIVELSDEMVLIGGGDVACDEALAARAMGKPVHFIPADLHHTTLRERAARRGEPPPTDFRGSAHLALMPG